MTNRSVPTTGDLVAGALKGRRLDVGGFVLVVGLLLALLISMIVLVTLIADMIQQGLPVLAERGWAFVSTPLSPDAHDAGIVQGIMGSLGLMLFVVVIAFPVGVASAIYLEEYAPDTRLTRFIVANVRNLAGVPSIVYGLLGLAIFVKLLGGITGGRTLISGGLTLAILVLPIMIITASEALRAVPMAIREAAFGVGATRWEVIRYQVLPVATPAILTGTVLTIARAFGESAPLLLSGAVLSLFFASPSGATLWDFVAHEKYTALPIIVFNWARQPQKEFVALTAAAIVVLLAILLLVNATAIVLRDRFERRT